MKASFSAQRHVQTSLSPLQSRTSCIQQRQAYTRRLLLNHQGNASYRSHIVLASAESSSSNPDNDSTTNDAPSNADNPSTSASTPTIPPTVIRKVCTAQDATEALDVLLTETSNSVDLTDVSCREIMAAAIERGNTDLAISIFRAMSSAAASGSILNNSTTWPAATIDTATALVLDFCRSLSTSSAIDVVSSVRCRGLPLAQDIQFGYVVECPSNTMKSLAVVQPQEGVKPAADAYSRYEYELFSGTVMSCSSDSLIGNNSGSALVSSITARLGLFNKPSCGAIHTAVVETPSGQQRTFRFGTITADVPAKVGDRVTVICSPTTPALSARSFLSSAPPGTKPGEALMLSNHTTKSPTSLLRPPNPDTDGLPKWLFPVALVVATSDAASSFIDPTLPYLIAGGVALSAGAAYAGNSIVLPKLKQLPDRVVEVQASRQKLLAQHTDLERKINQLVDECQEDIVTLARLWQLQNKMSSVSLGEAYTARLERVSAAKSGIEERMGKRLELLDGYAKVINMIEIEVEMETEVPLAEIQGIEQQIVKLGEIEELQEEWKLQAEAQDEVEKLLRASS